MAEGANCTTDEEKCKIIDLVQADPLFWNMRSDVYQKLKNMSRNKRWDKLADSLNLDRKYFENNYLLCARFKGKSKIK